MSEMVRMKNEELTRTKRLSDLKWFPRSPLDQVFQLPRGLTLMVEV